MTTRKRVSKIAKTKEKATKNAVKKKTIVKKTLKSQAYEHPDRDDDLKEYLNRKDFHSFELGLLMNDCDDECFY